MFDCIVECAVFFSFAPSSHTHEVCMDRRYTDIFSRTSKRMEREAKAKCGRIETDTEEEIEKQQATDDTYSHIRIFQLRSFNKICTRVHV